MLDSAEKAPVAVVWSFDEQYGGSVEHMAADVALLVGLDEATKVPVPSPANEPNCPPRRNRQGHQNREYPGSFSVGGDVQDPQEVDQEGKDQQQIERFNGSSKDGIGEPLEQ